MATGTINIVLFIGKIYLFYFYKFIYITYLDEMDKAGLKVLVELLNKIGLPYLGMNINRTLNKKDSYLSPILANIKKILNIQFLFATNVEVNYKNHTVNLISLRKPQQHSNNIFLQ